MRDAAVAAGITINAIPVDTADPIGMFDGHLAYCDVPWRWGGIAEVYRRDVIGSAGGFIVEAHDFSVFSEALKRKILMELIASR